MVIVTSGKRYIDIDAYGGCIAYAELLRAKGIPAEAVCSPVLNESVPPSAKSWPVRFSATMKPARDDTFVLIDVSHPAFFDEIVDPKRITEVIDHHVGKEAYWKSRLGDRSCIEFVGAACTMVYERWENAGLTTNMSDSSARLLACGILDNTLNFGAEITTARDRRAYEHLSSIANLPGKWPEQYFSECQAEVLKNVTNATKNDLKFFEFKTFKKTIATGQLVLWDTAGFVNKYYAAIKQALTEERPEWFLNLVDLSRKRSIFVSDNPEVQRWLENLYNIHFTGVVGEAKRLWLRKELQKHDLEKFGKRK